MWKQIHLFWGKEVSGIREVHKDLYFSVKLGVGGGGRSSSGCEQNGDRIMRRMGNDVEELLWGIS